MISFYRRRTPDGIEIAGTVERLQGGGRAEFRDAESLVAVLKSGAFPEVVQRQPPPGNEES